MEAGHIYEDMAAIAAEVGSIAKSRRNTQQNYSFRGIDDMYDALHSLLAKHRVTSVPEVLEFSREERTSKSGGVLIATIARVRYTFYARDGSSIQAVTLGEGMDSGDKSSNKAMAGAHKYALVQVFSIPTNEQADSEYEDPEPAPKAKPTLADDPDILRAKDDMKAIATKAGKLDEAKSTYLKMLERNKDKGSLLTAIGDYCALIQKEA